MLATKPNNRGVLITGCSSGIGLCVATRLQQAGYQVFATARQTEDVQHLQTAGFSAFQLDLTDSASIDRALAQVLTITHGRLYGLFNNGAYGQPGAVEDLSRETLRRQFETNVFGWHELVTKVLPIMRMQHEGRIIQNSSVLGFVALKFRGAYNASKFAIEGLSDTLRLELQGSNIYISLIEPGPIDSDFRKNALTHLRANIDIANSHFREQYETTITRLTTEGPAMPFTLPPEAVYKRVLHALESKRPKPRYFVTTPTYLFAFLKRILPTRLLDRLLAKI